VPRVKKNLGSGRSMLRAVKKVEIDHGEEKLDLRAAVRLA
jgi:hypothetical protein